MAGIPRVQPVDGGGALPFCCSCGRLVAAGVATITQAKISSTAEWLALVAFLFFVLGQLHRHGDVRRVCVPLGSRPRWPRSCGGSRRTLYQVIVFLSLVLFGLYLMAK